MPLLKRPFLDVSPSAPGDGGGDRDYTSHGDSGDGDEEESEERERGIAERVYRASEVNPGRRRILDLAFHHARLGVISADPHMEGIELDQLAINAWYMALKSLRLTHGYEGSTPPTEDELALIKARRHQVKGEIKTVARAVACGSNGYSFAAGTDAKSTNDNRDLVRNLLDEDGFVYRDHNNRDAPHSLYEHPAIQELVNNVFYKDESKSEAILCPTYFEQGFPLPALAICLTALECVIMERETGTLSKRRFVVKTFQPKYIKHLKNLMDWKVFTTNSGSELTQKLQFRLVQKGRCVFRHSATATYLIHRPSEHANINVTPLDIPSTRFSSSHFMRNEEARNED
ncbi:hypothetical protein C8J57DRAFT_1180498 [Mycena rebaudengoi]|nr:hypothetical protein C8J57DRAFT_1190432 [Mycena rebaudengoi]KAJ7270530.1 hypothetical protein C8J57DRAFT_1180498 [Mycena rebaudengoi]